MEIDQKKFEELLEKVKQAKDSTKIDLSTDEDLSLAVMNLISLEEHLFFTGAKTKQPSYFALLDEVRKMRKELMTKLLKQTEGETWCSAKHLLAASMRLIEVGTKLQAEGKGEEARAIFARAYQAYSMFWALQLDLVGKDEIKKLSDNKQPWETKDIMDKLVDCCHE